MHTFPSSSESGRRYLLSLLKVGSPFLCHLVPWLRGLQIHFINPEVVQNRHIGKTYDGVAVYRLLEISSCSENIPLILIRIQCLLFDSHDMIEAYGRKTDIETNYHSGRCTLQALRRWPWLFNFLLPWGPCPSLAHALRSLHWKQRGLCKAIVLSPLTLSLPKDWLVLRQRFLCRNVENKQIMTAEESLGVYATRRLLRDYRPTLLLPGRTLDMNLLALDK